MSLAQIATYEQLVSALIEVSSFEKESNKKCNVMVMKTKRPMNKLGQSSVVFFCESFFQKDHGQCFKDRTDKLGKMTIAKTEDVIKACEFVSIEHDLEYEVV